MKTCANHPQKEAFASCHNCGKNYCADCLDEGSEYYYCKTPQCQQALFKELLPENISCPNCNNMLNLSFSERKKKKVHCPECEAFINFNEDPPRVSPKEEYILLLYSMNQGDIGIIKSILDNAGVDYYLSGENFLTVEPLIQPARIFVNSTDLETARELLKDFKLNPWGAS
jgi:Putative prokaryotic signal transducing protein